MAYRREAERSADDLEAELHRVVVLAHYRHRVDSLDPGCPRCRAGQVGYDARVELDRFGWPDWMARRG